MDMTKVHGPEATLAIRALFSSGVTKIIRHSTETDVSIVAMTPEGHKEKILFLFDGQLPKPFNINYLNTLIETLFP